MYIYKNVLCIHAWISIERQVGVVLNSLGSEMRKADFSLHPFGMVNAWFFFSDFKNNLKEKNDLERLSTCSVPQCNGSLSSSGLKMFGSV